MKTANTYLPIFPGFYNTFYEPNEDNEINYINDIRAENNLIQLDFDVFEFNYSEYQENVGKKAVEYISNILVDELKLVKSIKYQSIYSPKEYNFANDSIDIEVKFNEKQVKKIKSLIVKNFELFNTLIKEKFTSCSGFHSWYSNNASEWLNELNQILEHQTQCATILQFLLLLHSENNEIDIEAEMFEYCIENVYLSCVNYEDATTKEYCSECKTFVEPSNFIASCSCCTECAENNVITDSTKNIFCMQCKQPILNNWYKRSIVSNVMLKNVKLDKIFCSDCQLLQK